MHHFTRCPHCHVTRDIIYTGPEHRPAVRCRQCRCRWNLQGDLLYFAVRCPLMTGKKPRPETVRNAQGRNLTGREAAPGSPPAQEQLL